MIHAIKVDTDTFGAIRDGYLKFVIVERGECAALADDYVALNEIEDGVALAQARYTGRSMMLLVTGCEKLSSPNNVVVLSLDPCVVSDGTWEKCVQVLGNVRLAEEP